MHDVVTRKRSRILVNARYRINKINSFYPGVTIDFEVLIIGGRFRFERDWYPQRKTLLEFGEKMVLNRVSYLCFVI